jgi:hypothetical protein
MKKFISGGLVAMSLVGMVGVSSVGVAGQRDHKAPAVQSERGSLNLVAFRNSLKPAQVEALVRASRAWKPLIDQGESVLMARVQQDVSRILTPAQSNQFMAMVEPSLTGGGHYFNIMCFSVSKVGLLFSLVGYIGCPSDVSGAATYDAYKASAYATTCTVDGQTSCESAIASAGESYIGWSTLISSCDVADTAAYSTAATYAFCGGTW